MVKNLMCLAGGVAIGYFIAVRRVWELEKTFTERVDKETEDIKVFYNAKYKRKVERDLESTDLTIKAAEAMSNYVGTIGEMTDVTQEPDEFDEEPPEEDEDEESDTTEGSELEDEWDRERQEHEAEKELLATVKPKVVIHEQPRDVVNYNLISTAPKEPTTEEKEAAYSPELIEKDAFINNESGFDQDCFTYFVGDDRLANDGDQVVSDEVREGIVNADILALLKEPEARGGASAVYFKDTLRNREFEITVSRGSYSTEVGEVVYATE